MRTYKFWILFLFLSLQAGLSGAQSLSFNRLEIGNGLPQLSVLAIAQDEQGFIWFGTRSGLVRFDGHAYRLFHLSGKGAPNLDSDYVTCLIKDHLGTLWIGTSNGLFRHLSQSDKFELVPGTQGKSISNLYEDPAGNLWVARSQGLLYAQIGTQATEMPKLASAFKVLEDKDVRAVFTDKKGRLWMGTTTGLWLCPKGRPGTTTMPITQNLPANCHITSLAEDSMQQIWVGTLNDGLLCLGPNNLLMRTLLHRSTDAGSLVNNSIRKLIADKNGSLWIGTQEGLSIYDIYTGKFRNYKHDPEDEHSLSQNSIYTLFVDEDANTWVGTYFGGANVLYAYNTPFHRQRYTRYASSLSNNVVSSFALDGQQVMWIGTEGGGLNWWNRKTGQFGAFTHEQGNKNSLSSNLVKSVAADSVGNIWVGTHRGGLSVLYKGSRQFENFNPPKPAGNLQWNVNAVLADKKNRIWVGTSNYGLQLFNPHSKNFQNYLIDSTFPFGLSNIRIRNIYEDARQQIWITTDGGVSQLHEHSSTFVDVLKTRQAPSRFEGTYNCVLLDNRQRLWLGSNSIGLVLAGNQPGEWEYFDKSKGLAGNMVYGILQDAGGFLWISTENGLSRFDIESRNVINYKKTDGLPGNEFNQTAFFKDAHNEMFFGGFNGFIHFNPGDIQFNQRTKPVLITDLLLGNYRVLVGDSTGILRKDISTAPQLSLSHQQNVFTLEFSALQYIKPEKTNFAWMLEGFDKTWQFGNQHFVTYTNLAPGKYTFLVKAANNDGIWFDQATKLQIIIRPPLWRTWWAYTLYAFLLGAATFFVIRFLWQRVRFKREASMQQFKLDFFTNISHEIRTHLSLILGPVEQLLIKNSDNPPLKQQLLHVRTNAERLMRLVSEMMDLRKAETNHLQLHISPENLNNFLQDVIAACEEACKARHIQLSFDSPLQHAHLYFDKVQMEKVFFNLLSNAIKFTPEGGQIRVTTEEDNQTISIRMIDNGVGMSAADMEKLFTTYFQVNNGQTEHAGYGIGLALAKSLVNLHKGTLSVESRPAKPDEEGYTCFTVQLLKGYAHFEPSQILPDSLEQDHHTDSSNTSAIQEEKTREVILLVDDNAELRAFIRESLQQHYTLIEADNGTVGLQMALEQIPDVVISDIMMPGLNGLQLCSTLKKDIRTSHIPVILLTAKVSPEQQVEGWQTGADIYITKPFSMQLLELQIANLLASRTAMRQRFAQQVTLQPRNIEITHNDESFLNEAIAIIEEHMDEEEFGVGMLSQKLAMSQPVLYKKLKALTDMSVNDFVKSIKLKKAAILLLQKQLNVNEVAFRVGFNDRKYFSREFKKQFGKTPSEYAAHQQD